MIAGELREVAVLLGATGLVALACHRLRLSNVVGFLAVGLCIGPHGLGALVAEESWLGLLVLRETEGMKLAAELGVAFLLFMIGLELSLDRLWRMRGLVFGLGAAQVGLTAAVIAGFAYGFGNSLAAAVALGAGLALSSTAIVVQLLAERGRLGTPAGRAAFGVLLFQDLAVVPVLLLVGLLGAAGARALTGGDIALDVLLALAKAALAILLIVAAGRLVLRPVLRAVADTQSREAFLAAVLLAAIGTAIATEAAGLSLALGAFLAGVLLAETEFRAQVAVDLDPFKGLLLGVFFVSVGLMIDPRAVAREPLWLLAAVLGLVAAKASLLYALMRLWGERREVAAEAALLLGQGGEFGFIVIALAASLGLLPPGTAQFMAIVVALTMLGTPLLAALGRRAAERLAPASQGEAPAQEVDESLTGHVIIIGYGRVGRLIGEVLDGQRVPHVALDRNAVRVAALRRAGAAVWYGEATQLEMLARLGAARAAALVVTVDDPGMALGLVATARQGFPALPILARVRDDRHAEELRAAGATAVVPEVREAALLLGEATLLRLGVPEEAARAVVAERRPAP
jgi:monovalent cation:proton antiporter-2 (CPA2) family protein